MKKKKTGIDELVKEKENLLLLRQEKIDKSNQTNESIGSKMKKLESLSYRNKEALDAELAEIDRKLNKIDKLIELEREYVDNVADENKSPVVDREHNLVKKRK